MKIAIIGAGISGLSAALELKKLEVIPTIYEKKRCIGQDMNLPIATLHIFERTFRSMLNYMKKNYALDLTPLSVCNEITMVGPSRKIIVQGKHGYIFKRGEDQHSVENQLAAKVALPIKYNSFIDINDVKNDFDYIIAATGDNKISKQLNIWTTTFKSFTRVATVVGNFKTGSVKMWVNTRYTKNSFCFMIPTSNKQAYVVLTIDNITHDELDFYWREFLSVEKSSLYIIDITDHEEEIGFSNPIQTGNIYITGNPSGAIDDAIGFGTLNSIESGIFAARSIVNNSNYAKMMKPVLTNVKSICEFRIAVNTFDNKDYDRLLNLLGFPVIKQLIYNNPLTKVKYGSIMAKALYKIRANR